MSAGHTPAPWGIGITYRDSITGFWQCLITRNGVAFITVGGATREECDANVNLIVAAPGMMEALEKIAGGHVPIGFLRGIENESKESFQERLNVWAQGIARAAITKVTSKEAA